MKIIKAFRKKRRNLRDPKKESIFRKLAQVLAESGYEVRREKLRQGHGWRVASGCCRANERSLVFVDQRLSQDDQIAFLVGRIQGLEVQPSSELLQDLPELVRRQLSAGDLENSNRGKTLQASPA